MAKTFGEEYHLAERKRVEEVEKAWAKYEKKAGAISERLLKFLKGYESFGKHIMGVDDRILGISVRTDGMMGPAFLEFLKVMKKQGFALVFLTAEKADVLHIVFATKKR